MKRGFRHCIRRVTSIDNDPSDSDENENGSDNNDNNPSEEGSKRKKRGCTQLKRPPNGQLIPIRPLGEEQFEFVNYLGTEAGIGGQITALLKYEYPSLIEESPTKKYYEKKWDHYKIIEDEDGMTTADRLIEEFWNIYSVEDEFKSHVDLILERFAAKQCKNMMYELRVDAVKAFYDLYLNQRIKDEVACKKMLCESQYLKVKPKWISDEAWKKICAYWCSSDYKKKRLLAQKSRMQFDFAQNRGSSRPYGQTKQYLQKKYGPEAATDINTFCCMKSGVKNCDSSGNSAPIPSEKAQKRVGDYFVTLEAEHLGDCEQRKSDPLDPQVLYRSSGHGLAHGCVPIANDAIRKCDMKGAARRTNTASQANSVAYQHLVRRNAQLEQGIQIGLVLGKHMQDLYSKLNLEVPAEIAAILQTVNANACAPRSEQGTESSHAGNAASGSHDTTPAGDAASDHSNGHGKQ